MSSSLVSPTPAGAAYDRFLSVRQFGSLDGLRCLGILAVLAHHSDLASAARYGVRIFFVISGFLVATLLIRERESSGVVSVSRFCKRRALRIFPLFGIVLVAYAVIVTMGWMDAAHAKAFWQTLPYYATFTSTWFVDWAGGGDSPIFFAWALAVEVQFYLVWPWFEKYLKGRAVYAALIFLFIASQTAAYIIGQRYGMAFDRTPLALIMIQSIRPEILGGIFLAHTLHDRQAFEAAFRLIGSRWPSLILLIFAVFASVAAAVWSGQWTQLLLALVVTAFIGACVIREDHYLARFLKLPFVAFVGLISYGIYLTHMLVKCAVLRVFPSLESGFLGPWASFVLTLAGSVAVASLSFYFFEQKISRK